MLCLDASELEANVKDSVEKAKQAVALDVTDGKSWGRRHLSSWGTISSLWYSCDGECSSLNILYY